MNSALLRKIGKLISVNKRKILKFTSIVGTFVTTGLAVEAGYRTAGTVKQMRAEAQGKDIPKLEYVKRCAPHFIPTVGSLAITVGSGIAGDVMANKEIAAATFSAAASEVARKELMETVKEVVGPKKATEIDIQEARKVIEQHPVDKYVVLQTGYGEDLCYDRMTDRYFYCSVDRINTVKNAMNTRILNDMWVTFNEVYSEMGLKDVELGKNIGWNVDNQIDFHLTWVDNDGKPMLVVDHYNRPVTYNNERI